jgi:hypothetical protein
MIHLTQLNSFKSTNPFPSYRINNLENSVPVTLHSSILDPQWPRPPTNLYFAQSGTSFPPFFDSAWSLALWFWPWLTSATVTQLALLWIYLVYTPSSSIQFLGPPPAPSLIIDSSRTEGLKHWPVLVHKKKACQKYNTNGLSMRQPTKTPMLPYATLLHLWSLKLE